MDWNLLAIRVTILCLHFSATLGECPSGYGNEELVNGKPSCLRLTDQALTFDKASLNCQSDYGNLIILYSSADQTHAVIHMIENGGVEYTWVGMTYGSEWLTVDEVPAPTFMTSNWQGTIPNPGEDYAVLRMTTGTFETRGVAALERGLCIRPPPVDGGWSNWSGLGPCEGAARCRQRTCTNPSPQYGGLACNGSTSDFPKAAYYTYRGNHVTDRDKKLTGFVLTEFPAVSLLVCTMTCSQTGNCMSVNYQSHTTNCQLNSETAISHPLSFVTAAGYTYFYMDTSDYFS